MLLVRCRSIFYLNTDSMVARFHNYTERPHEDREDWNNLKKLTPFLWDYRGRVLMALVSLVLAKFANVGVPIALKEIVDVLDQPDGRMLELPIMLLVAYGILKLSASLFNELRDALFARVRYRAMRHIGNRVLSHLYDLSLRYHLERKTGALTKDLERGASSVSSILNYLTFNIIPVSVEFVLVAGFLLINYEWQFAAVTFSTVVVYIIFTLMVTDWRIGYRLKMNEMDSQASMQAVDSLINYETVKYFGNEQLELDRYDKTLGIWEDAAVMSQTSMSALNFGQGSIIAVGVTLIMVFATNGVVSGSMSLGESQGGLPPDRVTEPEEAILRDSRRDQGMHAGRQPLQLERRRTARDLPELAVAVEEIDALEVRLPIQAHLDSERLVAAQHRKRLAVATQ